MQEVPGWCPSSKQGGAGTGGSGGGQAGLRDPAPRPEPAWPRPARSLGDPAGGQAGLPDADDHPALAGPWDLDAYLSWRHIAIRDQELAGPFFEQSLAQLQVRRQIAATLPDFGSAAALLRQSDLILTAVKGWDPGLWPGAGEPPRPLRLRRRDPQPGVVWPLGAIPPCAGSASGSCSWPGRWAPPR